MYITRRRWPINSSRDRKLKLGIEAWIPQLGYKMDAWIWGRCDEAEVWMRRSQRWSQLKISCYCIYKWGQMHEYHKNQISRLSVECDLRWYNPEDLEYKRNTSIFPHLTNKPSMSAVTSAMDWLGQPPGQKIGASHLWCGFAFQNSVGIRDAAKHRL